MNKLYYQYCLQILAKNFALKKDKGEQGFALPIILGFVLIILLVGLTMIIRSHENQVMSFSRKSRIDALFAAETGITKFQALLNEHRRLAVHCSTTTTPECSSATTTWSTLTASDLSSANHCGGGGGGAISSSKLTLIQNYADDFGSNDWQDIDAANPQAGQFRLVSYTYVPDAGISAPGTPGTGELIVEGRVNPETDGSNGMSTAIKRLAVKFPVSGSSGTVNGPGLWINSNAESDASGSVAIRADVKDSTCPVDSDSGRVAKLKTHLAPIPPSSTPVTYSETPGDPFPNLPSQGQMPPSTGVTGSYSLSPINVSGGDPPLSLPQVGEVANADGILTYHIGASGGKSINLNGGSDLTVGTGSETVVLHLDGELVASGGSSIVVALGSKLIVYAHGKVTLSGGSTTNAIENGGSPENAQLYVYGADKVDLSGGSGMSLFLFAPNSLVNFSSDSNLQGVLWAKAWKGSGSAVVQEQPVDLSQTQVGGISGEPRISKISSWQRQESP